MDKSYEPASFETQRYQQWERSGCFQPSGQGQPYSIMLPPPNVTGTLHMGHAFQHTLMDTLIRYHRMKGFDTLWQVGTDHAGIATEMVVNRNLEREGKGESRESLGRDAFIAKVWEWKEESGNTITRQMRRMGASGDWSRERFTMDEGLSEAVVETFVRLHEQGLIYRGQRLVNWDPVLKTAISDLEVVSEEENGFLWSIRYPLAAGLGYEHVELDADGNETLRETRAYLVVATTRPETMLGDVAVMVHPEDPRYAGLIGKAVQLPLCGREIPIIADDYVDRGFGTGVVKVTPAHDFNDYAVGQRHALPMINILTPDAAINDQAPAKYRGLDRYEARKVVLADLVALELLVEEKKHKLQVPRGDRTGQVIEPYLTQQWFVKMDSLGRKGLDLVESGAVRFVPPNWINTYRHWMGNIQDWCISRQLWWGHRIPAWYDEAGNIYVARSEAEAIAQAQRRVAAGESVHASTGSARTELGEVNESSAVRPEPVEGRVGLAAAVHASTGSARTELGEVNGSSAVRPEPVEGRVGHAAAVHGSTGSPRTMVDVVLRRDDDVLETWFSSALWSHSTLGWPNPEAMQQYGFERYLPSSVLVTGFDIIFFWVARMIMMTEHFTGQVPFRDVYITGLVRDKDGQKMSKSKGNVLDPIDLIDGISADALVAKRTAGLMQPQMAEKIEKATRKEFPAGIPAFGADALRFTFASLATHGRDIKFDLQRCEGYKNFCNKLWNAARFVLMNCEGVQIASADGRTPATPKPQTDAERWILHRLQNLLLQVEEQVREYRFDLASQAMYEFVWNEFCDWFLELAKPALSRVEGPALNGSDAVAAASTRHTLLFVLEQTLRVLHPLIPFITEEIWQSVAPKLGVVGNSISRMAYPEFSNELLDPMAAQQIDWLIEVVNALRSIRSQLGVAPSRQVALLLEGEEQSAGQIDRHADAIRFLARIESIDWAKAPVPAVPAVIDKLTLLVPLAGLAEIDAVRLRVEKDIKRIEGELAKCHGKLGNANFVANAPAEVVTQERQRIADFTAQLEGLRAQLTRL